MAVAAPAPMAADDERARIEAADEDTVTVRVETGSPNVDVFEESDTTNPKIGHNEPAHLSDVRHHLDPGQRIGLLLPRLAGSNRADGRLLDQEPPEGRLVLASELLLVLGIPSVRLHVEVNGLDFPNVEQ